MELPPNEAERLAALVRYGILDTDFEESFDRLTRLAANLFSTPIALVSLVDGHRQWFKSAHGLATRETPRDCSICSHVILGNDMMVVPNASEDPRFASNPLVTSAPSIRFYAGAPLVTHDGYALGTMCVIDRIPHSALSEREKQILKDLAAIAMDEIEYRYLLRRVSLVKTAVIPRTAKIRTAAATLQRAGLDKDSLKLTDEIATNSARVLDDLSEIATEKTKH
jgi:GAF domain-containing protein